MNQSPALLSLSEIEKSFYGVPVLQRVSFELSAGEVLGLVGENGAGKSTLMNILGGNLTADQGQMLWEGQLYSPSGPLGAQQQGIAFIHQELNLFANLSVAENLFLSRFPKRILGIDGRRLHREAHDLLSRIGLDIPTTLLVENLSAGERQLVEIAKALGSQARLLILDEPTTSLSEREAQSLFALMDRLRQQGVAMIFVSHALEDVRRMCNRIVVLRDGSIVGHGATAEFDTPRLVSLMVGRQLDQQFPDCQPSVQPEVVLSVRGLSQFGMVKDISFDLRAGEIMGLAGLMGSGRTELARLIFGLERPKSGSIEFLAQPIQDLTTRQRVQLGMAMLTESRREDGLCMSASIEDNLSLVAAPGMSSPWTGRLQWERLRPAIQAIRHSVNLTPAAAGHRSVRTLSGGNQQKVVLAKWLLAGPRLLILDEPTRGIDVGAKYEIYRLIVDLAARGVAVLMISSELEELLGLCHRLLVLSQGEIRQELSREQFDREQILHAALQSHMFRGGGT